MTSENSVPGPYDFSRLKFISDIAERFKFLPLPIKDLVNRAIEEVNPIRIYLFGSRVRGDFHEASDIDIGFELDGNSTRWSHFVTTENERARTLLSLDLVNFSDAHDNLRQYIISHGVVIYERSIQV